MSKLKLNITMSIDGFVAGPDQSPEHPLGVGGEKLHGWLYPAQGVPRRPRRGRRRGQREHAVRRGHPRRRRRDDHGPEHVRRRPGTVGRVVEGLVGRRSALPPSRLRPHSPSARSHWRCRAERRSTSSPTGSSRRSNRRGRQPERRTCHSGAGHRSRSNTSQRVCSTRSSSRSSRSCSEAALGCSKTLGDAKLEQVESVEAPGVTHIRYVRA